MKAVVLLLFLIAIVIVTCTINFNATDLSNVLAGQLHRYGPYAIFGLRALAVLLALVPSSPVVLASGATQGVLWGSIYVLAGALAGSLAAFQIGRWMGPSAVARQRLATRLTKTTYGQWLLDEEASQTRLMFAVLFCRLIPGLNLDGISYVAGATPLATWRFCLATLGGLLPYTIMLVAAGRGLVELSSVGTPHWLVLALIIFLTFSGLAALVKLQRTFLRPR